MAGGLMVSLKTLCHASYGNLLLNLAQPDTAYSPTPAYYLYSSYIMSDPSDLS